METAEKLKRHYDRLITLWQKKHLRMRQNMIFATIKVVKSWDFQQYISMEKEQRIASRRALNEDSDKLIQVGCFFCFLYSGESDSDSVYIRSYLEGKIFNICNNILQFLVISFFT